MNYSDANNSNSINNNNGAFHDMEGATSNDTGGRGGGGGSSIGMDMMAVATRIQERARILTEERRKVKDTDEILIELRQTRDKEQKINNRRRKNLLECINERNNVELEIFDVQDKIDDYNMNIELYNQQRIESKERIKNLIDKRTMETTTFYGPNLAQMESYTKALENVVTTKERVIEQRRTRLETMRNELERAKTKEHNINQETERIREDIRRRRQGGRGEVTTGGGGPNDTTNNKNSSSSNNNKAMEQDVEEITVLSKRVRETIDQVRVIQLNLFVSIDYSLLSLENIMQAILLHKSSPY
jgi:DNA repair exonuclease SbcCD ATPase subunit